MRRLLLAPLLASCGIFHGERVADRPRAPIDADVAFVTSVQPAPAIPPEVRFVEPTYVRTTLSNGVRVVMLQRGDLPIANITVAVARGSGDQPSGVAQVLVHRLWAEASADLDAAAAESDRFVARDAAGIEATTLDAGTFPALAALGRALTRPSFSTSEVEASRRFIAGRVRADGTRPETLAGAIALELSGFQSRLAVESVLGVTTPDLMRGYRTMFAPDSLVVSIVGKFDAARTIELLERSFGGLRGNAAPRWQSTTQPAPTKFVLVDRPMSSQASIAVVFPAPTVSDPDAATFQLACEVLSSRANVLARERKGYSYGVGVTCGALFDPIVFVSLDAENARAPEALADIVGSIEGMRASPPTDRELASARVRLGARLVGTFQSNRTASSILALATVHGAPPGALGALGDRSRTVTPEETARVIEKTMTDYRVAVVADRSAIPNASWPPSLGAPDVRPAP